MKKLPTKTTLQETDDGNIYRASYIPGSLFNLCVIKTKRTYKDGTFRWNICAEYAHNPKRFMVMDTVRGDRKTAIARLDSMLKHGC